MAGVSKTFSYVVPTYRRKKACTGGFEAIKVQDNRFEVNTGADVLCNIFNTPFMNISVAYTTDIEPILGPGRTVIGYRQTQRQQQISVNYYEDCSSVSLPSQSSVGIYFGDAPISEVPNPDGTSGIISYNTYGYSFDRNVGLFVVRETKIYLQFLLIVACTPPDRVLRSFQASSNLLSGEVQWTIEYLTITSP